MCQSRAVYLKIISASVKNVIAIQNFVSISRSRRSSPLVLNSKFGFSSWGDMRLKTDVITYIRSFDNYCDDGHIKIYHNTMKQNGREAKI